MVATLDPWREAQAREPIARAVARIVEARWPTGALPIEDAVQIAMQTMAGAIPRHDPARGSSLDTYCWRCVYFELARQAQRGVQGQKLELTRATARGDKEIPGDTSERASIARDLLDLLTPIERHVVIMYYGLDGDPPLALRDIGRMLDRRKSWAAGVHANALRKMRGG